MKITPKVLTSTQKEMVASNPALSSYLLSLDTGRQATPHSWLYESETSDETLTKWLDRLETVKGLPNYGERIYQFDVKQVEKFGPQGAIPPISEAIETLGPSYDPSEQLPIEVQFDELFNKRCAKMLMGSDRLETKRPLSYEHVVDDMRARDTLSTNSGAPDFGRRMLPNIKARAIQDAMSGKAYEYPGIVLFRKYNGKLRPVIMYPMSMNLIEFSFTMVIQDAMRASFSFCREYVTPWQGFDDVKQEFTHMWKSTQANGGDTTQMDAHFWEDKTEVVFNVVKWLFQRQYWDQLHRCMLHINHIDVLVGIDKRLTGPHGIASGSGWTQLVETVYQFIMAVYNQRILAGQGIGDDFVWFSKLIFSSDELADYLQSWGLPANPKKQSTNSEDCTFLQRMFLRGWMSRDNQSILGGVYPTVRALNSSLNPEKFHRAEDWNSDMFCIRQYMILENTVDHPLFEEFVKFVVNGQKDLVPFAKLSASKLDSIQAHSRLIPGLNPSYNQEKREKPLSAFAAIKYAKTL